MCGYFTHSAVLALPGEYFQMHSSFIRFFEYISTDKWKRGSAIVFIQNQIPSRGYSCHHHQPQQPTMKMSKVHNVSKAISPTIYDHSFHFYLLNLIATARSCLCTIIFSSFALDRNDFMLVSNKAT